MKKIFILLLFFTSLFANAQLGLKYPCPANGNAEANNFTNWAILTSTSTNPQVLNNFVQVANPDLNRFKTHNSTSSYAPFVPEPMIENGIDKYGGFSIPSQGNYCFSVGNNLSGAQAEMMKYTFTVTDANKHFKFRYALVFQDGGHAAGDNPSALFYMVKGNNFVPNLASLQLYQATRTGFVADLNDPYYKQSNIDNNVVYRSWECTEFDLSAYVGQQVSFIAMVRDCTQSAHWGYMYLDGLCTSMPATPAMSLNGTQFCKEQQIIMDAAASTGEDRYFVEVGESVPYGGYVPGGQIVSQWFDAQEAPNGFNLSNFIDSKGLQLKCGQEYNVTFAVANNCAPYSSVNKRFTIVCPDPNAGPDKTVCCLGEGVQTDPFTIGSPAINGNTYSWSSLPTGTISNQAQINVNPNTSTAYFVTMTQPNGCIGRDTVIVRFLPNNYLLSLTQKYELCDYTSKITASIVYNGCPLTDPAFFQLLGYPDFSFLNWYFKPEGTNTFQFLGTGQSIDAPNADGLVEARIQTPCSAPNTIIKSINIKYRPGGHGFIVDQVASPLQGGTSVEVNGVMVTETAQTAPAILYEYGPSAPETIGEGPAYGIVDFKLNIYNRYGYLLRTITKADVGRAPNDNVMQGDIRWDGKWQGQRVQDGSYVYTLDVLYCGENN